MMSGPLSKSVFVVGITGLGQGRPVPIEEAVYRNAQVAREGFIGLTRIEMSYNVLVGNFSELLEMQLRAATRSKLGQLRSRVDFMVWVQEFNRGIGNLLSSVRGYLDQTDRIIKKIFGEHSSERTSFKCERTKYYESVLGYRLLEEVRNYHQHDSLAVYGIEFPMRSVEREPGSPFAFSAEPYFDRTKLSDDNDIARKLADDLPKMPEKVYVLPYVNDYVEAISAIHQHVRTLTEASISDWTEKLELPRSILAQKCPERDVTPMTHLTLFEFPNEDLVGPLSSTTLFAEMFDDRNELLSKNRQLKNLRNIFVTSRPPDLLGQ